MKKIAPFSLYLESLNAEDKRRIFEFFENFSKRCTLNKKDSDSLRKDFENALIYYSTISLPLEKALELLRIEHLGGFYARPSTNWYTLDDAAKIYPLSMKRGQMKVFRLSVYLKTHIVPELLQMALDFTIKRFPSFATTVKKGFFWHYLDTAKRRYNAEPEMSIPCQPIKISRSNSQSFRVLWYQNRISVEFFHILTDGTGGMCFLKTLVSEYLRLCGIESNMDGILHIDDIPSAQEITNEFCRSKDTEKGSKFVEPPAIQMSGFLSKTKPCQVLHFCMDANRLKQAAKDHDATITAYILSKMFLAAKASTDSLDGEMNIQVPVNMRNSHAPRRDSTINETREGRECGRIKSTEKVDDLLGK